MSQDYEPKYSDVNAPAKNAGGEAATVEDPLVELARIVHKNKQSGADVSKGRVGNTDYFADLNDVAGTSSGSSSDNRREPSFAGSSPASATAPENAGPLGARHTSVEQDKPSREMPEADMSGSGFTSPEPTGPEDALANFPDYRAFGQELSSREIANREVSGHEFSRSGFSGQDRSAPEMASPATPVTRAADAADIADRVPHDTHDAPAGIPVDRSHVPHIHVVHDARDARADLTADSDRTEAALAPSVTLRLEENLTAELEDELIGALRQSVDEPSGQPEPAVPPYQSVLAQRASQGFTAKQPATGSLETSFDEYQVDVEADETRFDDALSDLDHSVAPQDLGEPLAPVPPAPKPVHETLHADPAPAVRQRPVLDENELFAALNPPDTDFTHEEDQADFAQDEAAPAGIDSLFADLDFPDPSERRNAGQPSHQASVQAPVQSLPEELSSSDATIDDMTWPAAAAAVPHAIEDETPPPPEGYDLDAVARAMQESDPSLTGTGVLPPHSSDESAAVPLAKEKSRRGGFVVAGVLGVAVLGTAGFFLFDNDGVQVPSGPPPVISGLQEPLKVYPEESQKAGDNQSAKLIYDRVDGTSEAGPDRLVVSQSPQPAELPPAPAGAENGADLVPGAPKRVRTLVVRPDGTIISDGDQAAATIAPPAATPSAVDSSRIVPSAPAVADSNAGQTDGAFTAPEPAVGVQAALPAAEVPAAPAIVAQPEAPETVQPAAPVPGVLPRKKPAAPARVAAVPATQAAPAAAQPSDGPLNLAQPTAASAPVTPSPAISSSGSIPSGTYIVQVTSQRTADAASDAYSSMQQRFPNVLGSRNAVIMAADLGDRGVFYRARIPTASRQEADSLCQSLQAAGGDCFVRRQP